MRVCVRVWVWVCVWVGGWVWVWVGVRVNLCMHACVCIYVCMYVSVITGYFEYLRGMNYWALVSTAVLNVIGSVMGYIKPILMNALIAYVALSQSPTPQSYVVPRIVCVCVCVCV